MANKWKKTALKLFNYLQNCFFRHKRSQNLPESRHTGLDGKWAMKSETVSIFSWS